MSLSLDDFNGDDLSFLNNVIDEENGITPPRRETLNEGEDRATELAGAEEWYRLNADDFRFDADRGVWLHWDGKRWAVDVEGAVIRSAMVVAKSTGDRLAGLVDEKLIGRYVSRAESAAGINGLLMLARALPGMTITSDRLDADPWALNCANGTVNLRTGELRPHRRADLNTIVLDTLGQARRVSCAGRQVQRRRVRHPGRTAPNDRRRPCGSGCPVQVGRHERGGPKPVDQP